MKSCLLPYKESKLNMLDHLVKEGYINSDRVLQKDYYFKGKPYIERLLEDINTNYDLTLTELFDVKKTYVKSFTGSSDIFIPRLEPIEESFNQIDAKRQELGIYDSRMSIGDYNKSKEATEVTEDKSVEKIEDTIKKELPKEIAETVTVVNEVPKDILGMSDIFFSLKQILNSNGIFDDILINWLGINKDRFSVNPKAIKDEKEIESIIVATYNRKKQVDQHPALKTNPLAMESFKEWVSALEKFPVAFRDAMLTHAIKYLNPNRTAKYVLQLSNVALESAYSIVANQPAELNRIGKLYDKEVLTAVSDAVGHEPSESGRGHWVHIPRTSSGSHLGYSTYEEFKILTERSIKLNSERIVELNEEFDKGIDDKVKRLEDLKEKLKDTKFYSQEPYLNHNFSKIYGFEDYDYVRVESSYSRPSKLSPQMLLTSGTLWEREFGQDFEGYYIHGYNRGTDPSKVLRITKEQAEEIWKTEIERYESARYEVKDHQEVIQLTDSIAEHNHIPARISSAKQLIDKQNYLLETVSPDNWKEDNKFATNVELLRKLSPHTWCTADGSTETYVEGYDNYLLIVNGRTVAGIEALPKENETAKTKVNEVTSIANNGVAPIEYLDDILAFFKKHNLDENNPSVKKAIRYKQQGSTDKDVMDTSGYEYDDNIEDPPFEEQLNERVLLRHYVEGLRTVDETVEAFTRNPGLMQHFAFIQDPNLRNTEEIARMAVNYDSHSITSIDENMPFYNELAIIAVTKNPNVYIYLSEETKNLPGLEKIYKDHVVGDGFAFSRSNNEIQGYYDVNNDKVVIVASNTPVNEASKVAIHEVAHRGMLRMAKDLGGLKQLRPILFAAETELMKKLPELLKRTGHKDLEGLLQDYGFDMNSEDGKVKVLSELAARWAETLVDKPKPSWWKEFIESIKNWIAKFTGKVLNEEEVNELVGGFVQYGTRNMALGNSLNSADESIYYKNLEDEIKVLEEDKIKIAEKRRNFREWINRFTTLNEVKNDNQKLLESRRQVFKDLGFTETYDNTFELKTSSYVTLISKKQALDDNPLIRFDGKLTGVKYTQKSVDGTYILTYKLDDITKTSIREAQIKGEMPFTKSDLKETLKSEDFLNSVSENIFDGLSPEETQIIKEKLESGEYNINCKL